MPSGCMFCLGIWQDAHFKSLHIICQCSTHHMCRERCWECKRSEEQWQRERRGSGKKTNKVCDFVFLSLKKSEDIRWYTKWQNIVNIVVPPDDRDTYMYQLCSTVWQLTREHQLITSNTNHWCVQHSYVFYPLIPNLTLNFHFYLKIDRDCLVHRPIFSCLSYAFHHV